MALNIGGKLLIGDKVVDQKSTTEALRPTPTVTAVRQIESTSEENVVSDTKKSQYVKDMSIELPPAYFDEE